ncbi:MAG: amidohydrolase family protein [Promethearchaeota archaeon]
MNEDKIKRILFELPVIDTHEHLSFPRDILMEGADLHSILPRAYIGDFDFYPGLKDQYIQFKRAAPLKKGDLKTVLDFIRNFNEFNFLPSLDAGLKAIHSQDLRSLERHQIEKLNVLIHDRYEDRDYYKSMLHRFKISKVILDIPHGDLGIGDGTYRKFDSSVFFSSLRVNSLLFSFDFTCWRPETDLIRFACEKFHIIDGFPSTFEDLLDSIKKILDFAGKKIVSYKCASAYERTLEFCSFKDRERWKDNYRVAKKIFGKKFNEVGLKERNIFGDVIFHEILETVADQGKPMQIHTGMAILETSCPKNLQEVISTHPDITFNLLHCGYPWLDETIELMEQYNNVNSEMVWLQMLDTNAVEYFLNKILDRKLESRVMAFGGDCACIEGSIGALIILINIMARIFTKRIEDGTIDARDVDEIGKTLLFDNANKIFFKK